MKEPVKIAFEEIGRFSPLFLDYLKGEDSTETFYGLNPTLENFEAQIKQKKYPPKNRDLLCRQMSIQYQDYTISPPVEKNLSLLSRENTFTITTGHQLNIFTGPLYFIYKIITTINACRDLNDKYPEYNFVPVYWMASEDHDFEEIAQFRLFGKKYQWKSEQKGAVGRFDPSELKVVLDQLPGKYDLFENAYLHQTTLSGAVRQYVNELFGSYGLLVVDADSRELKMLFQEVMKGDILQHIPHNKVQETNLKLEEKGYKGAVHAREINFFYLDDHLRGRIERKEDKFIVLESGPSFSENELLEMIENSPEKFSPNVILRPLYQETILPNLAYIGGPAEVEYWMQLKGMFDHFGIAFPILIPRNFALVIPTNIGKKLSKTGLTEIDLFKPFHSLTREQTIKHSRHELTLNGEFDQFEKTYKEIRERAEAIDPTLGKTVGAFAKKAANGLEKIEKKMIRAEKRKQADRNGQIEAVITTLFPNGNLQERTDNFLNFYMSDNTFISRLVRSFDPFDFRFYVLRDE